MLTDKELKKKFKIEAGKEPKKYYPVTVLQAEGFVRKQCPSCQKYFWTTTQSKVCGDSACQGRVSLDKGSPAKNVLSFIQVWELFKDFFKKRGYQPVQRYPVAARWNPTMEYTIASIAAFQPQVVSGEIDPPAKKLVIPQFCLRFGDIDNVGITGSHCTGFVMIGQHAFLSAEEWDQATFFRDIYEFLMLGIGLEKEELIIHEDAWAGGGNFGPCMEFFSRGVELFNQVYMMFEHSDAGDKPLSIKVLDMGLGMERTAWFTQGTPTIYDAIFPTVLEKLKDITNIKYDGELFRKFSPYASLLNLDEVEDIDKAWALVAKNVGIPVSELRSKIQEMAALYSIAEHTRALLVAFTDGALPSNVGGGYNLRVLMRRVFSFIEQHSWDINILSICKLHAAYLKPVFPELMDNLGDVGRIIASEKKKYDESKKRSLLVLEQAIKKPITQDVLIDLYDSHGITPSSVQDYAAQHDLVVRVPDNFYALVQQRHEKQEVKTQTHKEEKLPLDNIPATQILYYDHYDYLDFEATITKIIGNHVILNRTAFYPTSGGQLHDLGTINKCPVIDVFKQGSVIVHVLEQHAFKEGDKVQGRIDFERRLQLAQHHTATHILNGACRHVLGEHIWQAGAAKTLEKSRLDITHFDTLTEEEVQRIQEVANKIIKENRPVVKTLMKKNLAEAKYGFRLYQGGAVPGKIIRVIEIPNFDVEACGGTHLDVTGDVGELKIIRSTKVQDGIVRIEFTAGKASENKQSESMQELEELSLLLNCGSSQIPGRAAELFAQWKLIVKKGKQQPLQLSSTQRYDGDILKKTAEVLKTQPTHVLNTVKRFLREIAEKNA
ncbi:MAG: alanine--tRNA ligase [archaeon]